MEKKKLFIAVHQLNIGGVQKALINLLNEIDYDKYRVTLYVRKDRLDLLPQVNKNVEKIIINEDKTRYYLKPYSLWLLFRLRICDIFKNQSKADGIRAKISEYIASEKIKYEKKRHFTGGERYDVAVSYIQGWTAKLVAESIDAKRKIMFFHGSTDETHAVHEQIFDKFDKIVGVGKGVEDALKVFYPKWKDKITHIDNFVDFKEIALKSEEYSVKTPKNTTVLCSVGRLTKVKGFDLAIKSAKILKEKGVNFVWYIVGDGVERESLESLISKFGLIDSVILVGMKQNPYPYIKACDIYVQPSYEEAQPLTLTEAKILCKPIVSTKTIGGISQISDGKDGLLTEICSDGLAKGISELIEDENLKSEIEENLKAKDYSENDKRYRKEIDELLGGKTI